MVQAERSYRSAHDACQEKQADFARRRDHRLPEMQGLTRLSPSRQFLGQLQGCATAHLDFDLGACFLVYNCPLDVIWSLWRLCRWHHGSLLLSCILRCLFQATLTPNWVPPAFGSSARLCPLLGQHLEKLVPKAPSLLCADFDPRSPRLAGEPGEFREESWGLSGSCCARL